MKKRKGLTLVELIIIAIYLLAMVMLILPIILSAPGNSGFRTITAELPADFKETISIQRDYFECHLSYVNLEGDTKVRRYWFFGIWAPDINWLKPEISVEVDGVPSE